MNQAYSYCIYLLSRQDYSEHKLRSKLKLKQYPPEEIDQVIQKVTELGYLREENYRRLFIRKWLMKGEGVDKIRQRGSQEKLELSHEEFEQIQSELNLSDEDNLQKLVDKKLRNIVVPRDFVARRKLRDKTLRFLLSKGHSFEAARQAVERSFQISNEE